MNGLAESAVPVPIPEFTSKSAPLTLQTRLLLGGEALDPDKTDIPVLTVTSLFAEQEKNFRVTTNLIGKAATSEQHEVWKDNHDSTAKKIADWSTNMKTFFTAAENKYICETLAKGKFSQISGIDMSTFSEETARKIYDRYIAQNDNGKYTAEVELGNKTYISSNIYAFIKDAVDSHQAANGKLNHVLLEQDRKAIVALSQIFGPKTADLIDNYLQGLIKFSDEKQADENIKLINETKECIDDKGKPQQKTRSNYLYPEEDEKLRWLNDKRNIKQKIILNKKDPAILASSGVEFKPPKGDNVLTQPTIDTPVQVIKKADGTVYFVTVTYDPATGKPTKAEVDSEWPQGNIDTVIKTIAQGIEQGKKDSSKPPEIIELQKRVLAQCQQIQKDLEKAKEEYTPEEMARFVNAQKKLTEQLALDNVKKQRDVVIEKLPELFDQLPVEFRWLLADRQVLLTLTGMRPITAFSNQLPVTAYDADKFKTLNDVLESTFGIQLEVNIGKTNKANGVDYYNFVIFHPTTLQSYTNDNKDICVPYDGKQKYYEWYDKFQKQSSHYNQILYGYPRSSIEDKRRNKPRNIPFGTIGDNYYAEKEHEDIKLRETAQTEFYRQLESLKNKDQRFKDDSTEIQASIMAWKKYTEENTLIKPASTEIEFDDIKKWEDYEINFRNNTSIFAEPSTQFTTVPTELTKQNQKIVTQSAISQELSLLNIRDKNEDSIGVSLLPDDVIGITITDGVSSSALSCIASRETAKTGLSTLSTKGPNEAVEAAYIRLNTLNLKGKLEELVSELKKRVKRTMDNDSLIEQYEKALAEKETRLIAATTFSALKYFRRENKLQYFIEGNTPMTVIHSDGTYQTFGDLHNDSQLKYWPSYKTPPTSMPFQAKTVSGEFILNEGDVIVTYTDCLDQDYSGVDIDKTAQFVKENKGKPRLDKEVIQFIRQENSKINGVGDDLSLVAFVHHEITIPKKQNEGEPKTMDELYTSFKTKNIERDTTRKNLDHFIDECKGFEQALSPNNIGKTIELRNSYLAASRTYDAVYHSIEENETAIIPQIFEITKEAVNELSGESGNNLYYLQSSLINYLLSPSDNQKQSLTECLKVFNQTMIKDGQQYSAVEDIETFLILHHNLYKKHRPQILIPRVLNFPDPIKIPTTDFQNFTGAYNTQKYKSSSSIIIEAQASNIIKQYIFDQIYRDSFHLMPNLDASITEAYHHDLLQDAISQLKGQESAKYYQAKIRETAEYLVFEHLINRNVELSDKYSKIPWKEDEARQEFRRKELEKHEVLVQILTNRLCDAGIRMATQ